MILILNQTYNLSLHIHIVYQLLHSRNEKYVDDMQMQTIPSMWKLAV